MRIGSAPAAIVLTIAGLFAAATWWGGGSGALPRSARSSARDPVAENQRCEGCHQEIAAEWQRSQHHSAFTDPTFQAALAIEPKAFCRNCHAPEAPDASRPEGAQTLGIGCVTCHLAGEVVIAAERSGVSFPSHRVARAGGLGTALACAGCHQFPFDDVERRLTPLDMQRTIDEHASSPDAARSCADCHMPVTAAGHRSHAFASTRTLESLQKAVVVRAKRRSPTGIRVELESNGVGHAYPTGDLFRRIAVRAEVEGDEHRVLTSATRYLARHFESGSDRFGGTIREELYDNRLLPGETAVIDLELGDHARGMSVRWLVSLERVLAVADHQEDAAVVPERVRLAEGELAP